MNRDQAIEAVMRVLEDPDRAGFDTYRAEAEAVVDAIWPPQPPRKSGIDPMVAYNDKVAELARAAFALQELRYLAWTALKRWDTMSMRKAQRTGSAAAAMEAMRAALPGRDDHDS